MIEGGATSGVEVRLFVPGDAPGVVSLILPIQHDESGIQITLEAQPDLLDIVGFYQRGCGNFWVASSLTELVGSIALLDIGGSRVALRKMFVKRNYRGGEHRVAHRLVDAALEWCAVRLRCSLLLTGSTRSAGSARSTRPPFRLRFQ